jgi:hypothetical protein
VVGTDTVVCCIFEDLGAAGLEGIGSGWLAAAFLRGLAFAYSLQENIFGYKRGAVCCCIVFLGREMTRIFYFSRMDCWMSGRVVTKLMLFSAQPATNGQEFRVVHGFLLAAYFGGQYQHSVPLKFAEMASSKVF